MKKLIILLLFSITVQSQVAINSTLPQAALDVTSSNMGFLPPRLSLTGSNVQAPCTNPNGANVASGTLIYNTNSTTGTTGVAQGLYYFENIKWMPVFGVNSVNGGGTIQNTTYQYNGTVNIIAGSGLVNIAIGTLGFTSISNVMLTVEKTSTNIRFLSFATITAPPTTANVSVAIVESNTVGVLGAEGLELSVTGCVLHITIVGTR